MAKFYPTQLYPYEYLDDPKLAVISNIELDQEEIESIYKHADRIWPVRPTLVIVRRFNYISEKGEYEMHTHVDYSWAEYVKKDL